MGPSPITLSTLCKCNKLISFSVVQNVGKLVMQHYDLLEQRLVTCLELKVTFMVEDTVDKEDSSDSLDSEPPGDKLRFLRFLRGRPFRFGAEIQKHTDKLAYPAQ